MLELFVPLFSVLGQFWTAPELLGMPAASYNGTPKGDVYSFGIILYEMNYRTAPYETKGKLPMRDKGNQWFTFSKFVS